MSGVEGAAPVAGLEGDDAGEELGELEGESGLLNFLEGSKERERRLGLGLITLLVMSLSVEELDTESADPGPNLLLIS